MSINSHVQLPNGILKYFRDESDPEKKVWYLDIATGNILRKPAGKLGTIKGYFSDGMEQVLSAEIESPITQLNAKIRKFANREIDSVTITTTDIAVAKRYIKASMLRSKPALDALYKGSYTAGLCSEQENHDDLVFIGLQSDGPLDNYLSRMSMCILVNRTERHFVIPRNCYYELRSNGTPTIIAPISPFAAISLLPPNYPETFSGYYGTIDSEDDIALANQVALNYERATNGDFVASDREAELQELIERGNNQQST